MTPTEAYLLRKGPSSGGLSFGWKARKGFSCHLPHQALYCSCYAHGIPHPTIWLGGQPQQALKAATPVHSHFNRSSLWLSPPSTPGAFLPLNCWWLLRGLKTSHFRPTLRAGLGVMLCIKKVPVQEGRCCHACCAPGGVVRRGQPGVYKALELVTAALQQQQQLQAMLGPSQGPCYVCYDVRVQHAQQGALRLRLPYRQALSSLHCRGRCAASCV